MLLLSKDSEESLREQEAGERHIILDNCILKITITGLWVSEKIVTMWPTNDLITLTRKGIRGVGAQPPLFNKQNVKIYSYVINCAR